MKAFTVSTQSQVYFYSDPVSMSYGFPRLRELVTSKLKKDPASKDLYLFHNKKLNYVKILFHSNGGYCIFMKRLEKGVFDLDSAGDKMKLADMEKLVNYVLIGGKKQKILKAA